MRILNPERRRGKLTRYAASPAGNISPELRLRRRPNLIIRSDQLNFSAEKFSDESDAEGDIGPFRFRAGAVVERKRGPRPRIRGRRPISSFVGMPDAAAVAIVDEPLVELQPPVVSAQEVESRHRLEPHQ